MKKLPQKRALSAAILSVLVAAIALPLALRAEDARPQITVQRNVMVPMRDGVRLATDIYRPAGDGKYPVMLKRTPYMKSRAGGSALAAEGWVVALQDCRGRFDSEGEFSPMKNEGPDGYDAVEWLAAQPWSDGKVFMSGESYDAVTQVQAAMANPPHLTAVAMAVAPTVHPELTFFPGGQARLEMVQTWMALMALSSRRVLNREVGMAEWMQVTRGVRPLDLLAPGGLQREGERLAAEWRKRLPLRDPGPLRVGGRSYIETVGLMMDTWYHPELWDAYSAIRNADKFNVPCLIFAGTFDIFGQEDIELWRAIRERGGPKARENTYLILGPFRHGGAPCGDLPTPDPWKIMADSSKLWRERWTTGRPNEVDKWPKLRLIIGGTDREMQTDSWPPVGAKPSKLYLTEDGLSPDAQKSDEMSRSFVYDPSDPCPTLGGCTLTIDNGMRNHARLVNRPDVLVFDGPPLERDMIVAGRVKARLFIKTDAPDTDFTAMLLDVYPAEAGKEAYRGNVCDGVTMLRFRKGLGREDFVKPGEIVEIEIDLWSAAHCFKKGHRLAVHLSSSNFPRFARNLNTSERCGFGSAARKAVNTVFFDKTRPSAIEFSVVD
ncbi:MAG TPA: CocE/NonD family hydrolase [Candidatus Brocadiia bacterium]|nr:CocE/NonD family hydrolase [Candidatus Brocadiia bacterium]